MSDKKAKLSFDSIQMQQDNMNEAIMKNSGRNESMMNLIRNATGSSNKTRSVPRLAFDQNPINQNNYAGIYKYKVGLLPDNVIKQIRVQNFLVAAILRSRGNTLSMFGHLRQSRFDVGIDINVKEEFKDHIEPEQMVKIQERIDRFAKVLINCGYTEGLREDDKMTFPEWLDIQTRNGTSFGRFATEFVYEDESNEVFHRFRTADVGTMYRSVKKGEYAEGIRRGSAKLLEEISGVKIDKEMLEQDEYSWIQVIDGQPRQAFTPKELIVYNLYPSSDIEHNGYPVTPLDTVITSITTHMAIEEYNKLYFQNGRANKGMLVIKSDEIDQSVIEDIKQQYNASINNVQNSFRTPIFGVSKDDEVNWVPTVSNQKDGEFQFLFDQTTRNILSAFNMSPDELPGFGHLSRGTNQQGLSESSNEFKLQASRDGGIRPLILRIQDFINEKLFPIMDKELSQLCYISLSGFDAETKSQESTRIQQDMPIHYDYDQVMEEVDKEQVGAYLGGTVPFNEMYRQITDTSMTVGKYESHFMDSPAAIVDPILKFRRDQFWFQHIETLAQYNPAAAQAYYATRKNNMETLKLFLIDYLEETE